MQQTMDQIYQLKQTIDQIYPLKRELQSPIEKIQTLNKALSATIALQEKLASASALSSLQKVSTLAPASKFIGESRRLHIDGAFQAPDYIRQLQQQLESLRGAQIFAEQIAHPLLGSQQLAGKMLRPATLRSATELQYELSLTSKFTATRLQQSSALWFDNITEKQSKSYRGSALKIKKAILSLVQYVWYFDFLRMPISDLWDMEEAIASGGINEVEKNLVNHFESYLQDIEQHVMKQFPRQSHVLSEAITLHRIGYYTALIPALLSQIDGICMDLFGQPLFMGKDKKPRTAIYVEQVMPDAYTSAILSPFAMVTPITASEYDREKGFNQLNRHMVLHGDSLDYGTKANSLKVISLINYLAYASHMLRNL